jgi:hypothetical protein
VPVYANASALTFGRNVGCSFYTSTSTAYAASNSSQDMYCTVSGKSGCTSDYGAQVRDAAMHRDATC